MGQIGILKWFKYPLDLIYYQDTVELKCGLIEIHLAFSFFFTTNDNIINKGMEILWNILFWFYNDK